MYCWGLKVHVGPEDEEKAKGIRFLTPRKVSSPIEIGNPDLLVLEVNSEEVQPCKRVTVSPGLPGLGSA